MNASPRTIVEEMFAAFGSGDADRFVATVSDDTTWIYHGTQVIPKGTFTGKDGVSTFFRNIHDRTEILSFEPRQFIVEGNVVVVLGREHQRVKRSGRELKQQWVQIYTIEHNLIARMEEFATSEDVAQ